MAIDYQAPSFSGQTPNALELSAAFATIESVLQNALSTQGTTPNQMEVDLDMNGHDLLNVGASGARVLTTTDLESLTGVSDAALQSLNTDIIALGVRVTDVENVQVTHANLLSQLVSDLDDLELVVAGLSGGTGGVTDHGALTGLGDDDHPHYLTEGRGDLRYYTQSDIASILNGYSPATHNHDSVYSPLVHTHTKSQISDFTESDYATAAQGLLADSALQTLPVHTHVEADITDLDKYTQAEVDQAISDASLGGGGGITDHGALTGLNDDDHPHYLTEARGDIAYYPRAEMQTILNGYSPTTHNHDTLYAPLVHDHDTRPAGWTATNDKTEIEWDSGNAKYTLRARDGAVNLTKNPADTDAINNWVLPFGLYAHDPLAAHLFGEGTPVMIFGSNVIYRVLDTATVAEKQADPSTSAGYGLTNS